MKNLGIKEVKPTRVALQMANKFIRHAHEIVENVLLLSRALIDMEKGELILRVHEESLILNVYKPMNHHGKRSNLKINTKELTKQDPPDKLLQAQSLYKTVNEKPNPSLNRAEIKRNKSRIEQASYIDKFPQTQLASEAHYLATSICHRKQDLAADTSPMKIDPP
ncbi:hypothetical protein PIB30_065695 [Stylosanthes scabra]|uniref:Uncharacterized protein n=1 Tax=Stylosanthes scabra TaxID=79078 RepID=A0ABU6TLW3_9FABA|nr:hypothetical protein [Stylosanthes scabra]